MMMMMMNTALKENGFEVTFKTFTVEELLHGNRKTVASCRPSEDKAMFAKLQPCSRLLVRSRGWWQAEVAYDR